MHRYGPAKWGLALRSSPGTPDSIIERAINQGRILRTHVLRPTWHFVTPADIRWMLDLTGPIVHRRMSPYDRQMGLDPETMIRATGVIEKALGDGAHLTRGELGVELTHAGLPGRTRPKEPANRSEITYHTTPRPVRHPHRRERD